MNPAWTVVRISGFNISHPWLAKNPACPDTRHPTRDCGCTVFRTAAQAQGYADERTASKAVAS